MYELDPVIYNPSHNYTCNDPLGPAEIGLGLFLLIGTVVSYLPQHIKLFIKKSHVGISLETANFGLVVSWAHLCNFGAIQYYVTFQCCGDGVSNLDCFVNLMPFLQLVLIWACTALIAIMYVIYFDSNWLIENGYDAEREWKVTKLVSYLDIVVHILFFVIFFALAYSTGIYSDEIQAFGKTCSILTSIGLIVQWGPQIISTYKLKRVGSLSIPMLVLQAGGVFLTAFFFSLSADNFWVVIPFFVSFFMLTLLAIIAIYYHLQEQKREKEKQPLLGEQDSDSALFSPKKLYVEPSGESINRS